MVHQNTIKVADLGLSRRIETSFNIQSKLFRIIPYIDPKSFTSKKDDNNTETYILNEKSDIYSVGVLLWEISSGKQPFCNETYDFDLVTKIFHGFRETPVSNTPVDYIKIYSGNYNLKFNSIIDL